MTRYPEAGRGLSADRSLPVFITRNWLDVDIKDPAYNARGNVLDGTGTISGGALSQLSIVHPKRPQGFLGLDTNALVVVSGAGTGGVPLTTTIASVSAGVATLAAPAVQGVTSVRVLWGADDTAPFDRASAVLATNGGQLIIPAGGYFVRDALTSSVRGGGSDSVTLYRLPDRIVNGTYYATGNWHPAIGNPQALNPATNPVSIPDLDISISGITIDLLADPLSNGQAGVWNGLQGNGIDLYSLLRCRLNDVRVQNAPFGGIEIASNRAASDHLDGIGNTGAAVDSEIPTSSGAYLKELAPCKNISADGRIEVKALGWQWANYYGPLTDHRVYVTITAPATQVQVYDGTTTAAVNGAQPFPTGTLTVASTTGFTSTGRLLVAGVTGVVSYTGKTGTTFTGCTGGTGTAADLAVIRPAADLSHYFPGLRIGIGSRGVWARETPTNSSYEVATVKAINQSTNTVTLDSATTLDHGTAVLIGPVVYWGDPGFGVVLRNPVRNVTIAEVIADYCGWGGCSMGQSENYQFSAVSVRGVHINSARIQRCGAGGAPAMKVGFVEDCSIGNLTIGDRGGQLLNNVVIGGTSLVLRTSESRHFFAREVVRVGNPTGTNEVVTIASVINHHNDDGLGGNGLHVTSGSTTVTNATAGAWAIGEKIEGVGIAGNTTVANVVGTTLTLSQNANATATAVPLQGGDTLLLTGALTANHSAGEDVFYDPASSPGLAIQEVGSVSSFGVKVANVDVIHHFDGVQVTNKDGGGVYFNQRHSLANIHSRRNLRYGFNEQDAQNVTHTGCFAIDNGDTGFFHNNANAALQRLSYSDCQAYGNLIADWAPIAGKYLARNCYGLQDTGTFEADFGNGALTTFSFSTFTTAKFPLAQVIVNATGATIMASATAQVAITPGALNATGLYPQTVVVTTGSAPATNAYHLIVKG